MQISELDHIGIDDRQLADPRSAECGNDRASDPTRADNADLRQHDVPRVAVEFFVEEVSHSSSPAFAGEEDQRSWWRGLTTAEEDPSTALRAVPLPSKSRGG